MCIVKMHLANQLVYRHSTPLTLKLQARSKTNLTRGAHQIGQAKLSSPAPPPRTVVDIREFKVTRRL